MQSKKGKYRSSHSASFNNSLCGSTYIHASKRVENYILVALCLFIKDINVCWVSW